MSRRHTPDTARFAKRPYDLVKEVVFALVVVLVLSLGLAALFSSPDERPITLSRWAIAAPNDVVATATGELAGTTASAGYGPPYNSTATGQQLGPLKLQQWSGERIPVDSTALVLGPLAGDPQVAGRLATYRTATRKRQLDWATAYGEALAKAPAGDPAKVATGDYGPVPALSGAFLRMARAGGLEGSLSSSANFYGGDQTRTLLLLSDGAYLEDQARARSLGGDQWGMMNETGNYPGQPWMWLYTFWYQVKPFSTSANADAQVWALMMVLTLVLLLVPFLPGIRSIPRLVPLHRLIWRDYYHDHPPSAGCPPSQ